jgi:hypothetical protein
MASANSDTTILLWEVAKALAKYQRPTARHSQGDLRDLWERLHDTRGPELYAAMGRLAADPATTGEFLVKQLQDVHDQGAANLADVPRLIADLANPDLDARDKAFRELELLGDQVGAAVRTARAGHPHPNAAFHMDRLLARLTDQKLTPERLRQLRALSVLERLATEEIRLRLGALGTANPATWTSREAAAGAARLGGRL